MTKSQYPHGQGITQPRDGLYSTTDPEAIFDAFRNISRHAGAVLAASFRSWHTEDMTPSSLDAKVPWAIITESAFVVRWEPVACIILLVSVIAVVYFDGTGVGRVADQAMLIEWIRY